METFLALVEIELDAYQWVSKNNVWPPANKTLYCQSTMYESD